MTRRLALAAALGLTLPAVATPSARAGDVVLLGERLHYDLTESLMVEDHDRIPCVHDGAIVLCDSGDRTTAFYQDVFSRLDLAVSNGAWRAGVRWDDSVFANTPTYGPMYAYLFRDRYRGDHRLEKLYVSYTSRHLELTLGDSYVQFGSGIALSLRKIDELGADTSLRGAKLAVHDGPLAATAVAGFTNTANVSPIDEVWAPDANDFVYGSRVEVRVPGAILGVHGVGTLERIQPGDLACTHGGWAPAFAAYSDTSCQRVYTLGATVDVPLTPFGLLLHAEGDLRRQVLPPATVQQGAVDGHAFYLSGTYTHGPATVLAEYKDYGHLLPTAYLSSVYSWQQSLQVPYAAMPSLERPLSEVLDESDVRGPHVRLDWSLGPGLLVYASGAAFLDDFEGAVGSHGAQHLIVDPYAGAQLFWQHGASHAFFSGGERLDSFRLDGAEYNRDLHAEWAAEVVTRLPWSVGFEGDYHYRTQLLAATDLAHWQEADVTALLKRSPDWIWAAGYELTTQGIPISTLALATPSYPTKSFPNVSAIWNVTSRSSVSLFVGGSRGGLRCYNVCRVYPPFLGARLSATVRF